MSRRRSRSAFEILLVGGLLYSAGMAISISHADVTPSGLGTAVNQSSPGVFDITGGTRPSGGTNLFHSFGDFSLDAGQSGNFINDSGLATANILGRVTGGPSNIFGTIDTSAFPGANLFLMNPAGILFGPTALLNVDGSFHATTADYIGLADGTRFNAVPSGADALLTAAAPSAFGFLTSNPAPIDVDTSAPTGVLFQVPTGQTISFVGGTINVGAADGSAPGYVMAPAGTLNLVSVASPGEATFNSPINVDGFAQLGEINIRGNSMIDGKDVFVRAGRLTMGAPADPSDPSSPVLPGIISPGVFSLFGLGPETNGGEVNIDVTGDVVIAGDVPEPLLDNPGGIISFSGFFDPAAKVPDVTINAGGTVSLSGFSGVQLQRFGFGDPAQVTVNADSIKLEKGASIALLNFFEGPGGNITLNAQKGVDIAGDGSVGPTGATGLLAQGLFHPFADFFGDPAYTYADSGSININTGGTLRVSGDGIITTTSIALGSSSDININAHDIFLSDRPGHINANSFFAGPSGNININASGQVEIKDGFVIFADTNGTGAGGNVNITAAGPINISGEASGIATQTAPPSPEFLDFFALSVFGFPNYAELVAAFEPFGLPPNANMFELLAFLDSFGFTSLREPLVAGHGGSISVTTPILTVSGHDSAIDSGTGWDGNGGLVAANVGTLTVSGGGQIRSRSGLFEIGTNNLLVGNGNAGRVEINASGSNTITISGKDSSISTTSLGDGNGGDVVLGSAGDVKISSGGSVTADSFGAGLTGNINITAGNSIIMQNGTISTQAVTSDGGNIKLTAPNIVQLTGSQITTSVESGEGGGGNINIDPQFTILNNSQITANAFGGPGGNITLTSNNFLASADSTVQASSALSTQGTIVIESPENDIAGSISQLPQSIVDVSGLLPERCAARGAGGAQSSFVVAGRGGLPTNPDNYLPSFGAGSGPVKSGGTTKPGTLLSEVGYTNQTTVAMAGWGCPR